MVEALGYRLEHILIARYSRRRYRYYEIDIAQESYIAAIDLGIRYLSAMAAKLLAMLVDLSIVMLMYLPAVMPRYIE